MKRKKRTIFSFIVLSTLIVGCDANFEKLSIGEANVMTQSFSSKEPINMNAKEVHIEVPFTKQKPELPRGCEVTSLSMLLGHAGVTVDKMELAKNIKRVPFLNGDIKGNMHEGFVGDMYSFETPGLGVYNEPIFELGSRYLPKKLVNLSGKELEDVYNSLRSGKPVWVITNDEFDALPDSAFQTWNTNQGEMKVTYHEHSVVLTGFDEESVYINDPLYHEPNRKLDKKNFEESWIQMGKQAITYRN